MKFALSLVSELLLQHSVSRLSPPPSFHPSSCLLVFVSLSLSISLSSLPTCFIETVKVKTNPIDQPVHTQMDVGSHYRWMDDGRWMKAGDGAEEGIWRGLLKCHEKRCIGLLCFPTSTLLAIHMICVSE